MMDVIRCDEENYLIWKWRPSGAANSTHKENAIRWGSSLRVKDGEVAVFVYQQKDGANQDFIEGPFDETIKTSNFPVITSILGLAYAGQSPFQAEVYFINLQGQQDLPFGVPYFDVFDNRFLDFPVRMAARGSIKFKLSDYRAFIKLHRLIHFDLQDFRVLVRDAVLKYVKGIISNAPADHGIPVLQIERKLLDINDLIEPRIAQAFRADFGVELVRFDLATIEVDKSTEEYQQLRSITADLEVAMRQKQNDISIRNLDQTQDINAVNMRETLRIQREAAEKFQTLQTETQHLAAHQINQQTRVLEAAANNLGEMGAMSGGGSGGGFNPVGMMTGLAVGGAMGGQMANMMNMNAPAMQPPPPPQLQYHISVNGVSTGPFGHAQLQEMARGGQLLDSSHAWKPGMGNWELAGNLPELAAMIASARPPMPPPQQQQQQRPESPGDA
ncbi:SPFH domain-containing protein [Rugamonas sp.]|uniref:SPFH domain-containing protein n=1 Tax=Rugamonas sp. TaxID=1926287 RepID=UPI0025E784C2|nr:SPFH domain-containing protein [Rugamonas sp.]